MVIDNYDLFFFFFFFINQVEYLKTEMPKQPSRL